MKRQIESQLLSWRDSTSRKPLIVRGARQVGKTYSICDFGKTHFKNFVHFDFIEQKSLHRIFEGDLTAQALILQLEAISNTRIIAGETLIFFDEIQACPQALMSLRYFYEQMPSLHCIAAGSLLEFSMGDASFPVGRVDFLWMYPMSFSEFLAATNQELLRQQIPTLTRTTPIPAAIHEKLIAHLRIYCIVGGMPEAVLRFVSTGSLTEVAEVHRLLTVAFRQDIPRYHKRVDATIIEQLFDAIPRAIGTQIKYTGLVREARIEKIKAALGILEQSLLVRRVNENSALGLPLGANVTENRFKLIMLDIGLMQHLCGILPIEILQADTILDVYRGAIAEQLVGQQLVATGLGSENGKLFYWSRNTPNSKAEVDYIVVRDGRICPIEVKSGATGKLKSLNLFLKEHPSSGNGFVLSTANIQIEPTHQFIRLPLYTELI